MNDKIHFQSRELVAMHEAGHAETALSVGARVVLMELLVDGDRQYGRTRVDRTDEQRMHILLGGFASEYRLYRAGRLLKTDGSVPTEKEFIDNVFANAREDRVAFFTVDADFDFTKAEDTDFMKWAIGRAENRMRFELVERIADALLAKGILTEDEIKALATGP